MYREAPVGSVYRNEDNETTALEMAPASMWRVVPIENSLDRRDECSTRDQVLECGDDVVPIEVCRLRRGSPVNGTEVPRRLRHRRSWQFCR